MFPLRTATRDDIPELQRLIEASVRTLSRSVYTPAQTEAALRHVFGVDTQLVADLTYYVLEGDSGLVAAGGWSARRTMYGGDQAKTGVDGVVDPATAPARIRAFFVHPDFTRRGFARRLFAECETAARARGFRAFELVATLPGEPLYRALGFHVVEPVSVPWPGDLSLPCLRMHRSIDPDAHPLVHGSR